MRRSNRDGSWLEPLFGKTPRRLSRKRDERYRKASQMRVETLERREVLDGAAPQISDQGFTILPNLAPGEPVGTVLASDPDPGQQVSFAISAGNPSGAFAIDPNSGDITIADSQYLNAGTSYDLTVEASDDVAPVLTSAATITVAVADTKMELDIDGNLVITDVAGQDDRFIVKPSFPDNLRIDTSYSSLLWLGAGLTSSTPTVAYAPTTSFSGTVIVYANAGNDRVEFSGTFSQVTRLIAYGGEGNDRLVGGAAEDELHGEDGNDTLMGGDGNDTLFGGDGRDSLSGYDGDDWLDGGLGNDTLQGLDGNDVLIGGPESGTGWDRDSLSGGFGDDILIGGYDNDNLSGYHGHDLLIGGEGSESLVGGNGDDILVGGPSTDYLQGNADGNLFIPGATAQIESSVYDAALVSALQQLIADWATWSPSQRVAFMQTISMVDTEHDRVYAYGSPDYQISGGGGDTAYTPEEAPLFDGPFIFDVDHLAPIDTVVGTATAIDPNHGESVSYALTDPMVPFAIDASTGVLTVTSPPDQLIQPVYTFGVTATDPGGLMTSESITINVVLPVNEPPVAANDSYILHEDELLSIAAPGVLGNDSDPEVEALSAHLVAGPSDGILQLSPDGSFTFDPRGVAALQALPLGTSVDQTFVYEARDPLAASSQANVTITVAGRNDEPTAQLALPDIDVGEGASPTLVPLTGAFADVDTGDVLTLSVANNSNPALVSPSLVGDQLTLTYATGMDGTAAITVRATDLEGALVESTFQVNVIPLTEITVSPGSPSYSESDPGPAMFVFTRDNTAGTLVATFDLMRQLPGEPPVPLVASVVFMDGSATANYEIPIVDDDYFEGGNESYSATLLPSVDYKLGATTSATLEIQDDEAPPTFALAPLAMQHATASQVVDLAAALDFGTDTPTPAGQIQYAIDSVTPDAPFIHLLDGNNLTVTPTYSSESAGSITVSVAIGNWSTTATLDVSVTNQIVDVSNSISQSEDSGLPAGFTFTRSATGGPLSIQIELTETPPGGSPHTTFHSVSFSDELDTATFEIANLDDQVFQGGATTYTVTIVPGDEYDPGLQPTGLATITDNELPPTVNFGSTVIEQDSLVHSIPLLDKLNHGLQFPPASDDISFSVVGVSENAPFTATIYNGHAQITPISGRWGNGTADIEVRIGEWSTVAPLHVGIRTENSLFLDFGATDSPVASGYLPVWPSDAYDSAWGFGWSDTTISSSVVASPTGNLGDDAHAGSGQGQFLVDLPAGVYDVTLLLGENQDQIQISLEGQVFDTVTTASGEQHLETYSVTVADGQLTLDVEDLGGADAWNIAGLVITPVFGGMLDDGDTVGGVSTFGVWNTVADPTAYAGSYLSTTDPTASAIFDFDVEIGKSYMVLATWVPDPTNTINAEFELDGAGGADGVTTFNQEEPPTQTRNFGVTWDWVGTFDAVDSTTIDITVRNGATGRLVIDAIRVVELSIGDPSPMDIIIDELDPSRFAATGDWAYVADATAYQGSYLISHSWNDQAHWHQYLEPNADYEILATWQPDPNLTDEASYEFGGSYSGKINQRVAPSDQYLDGFWWKSLGTISGGAFGGTATLTLSGDNNGVIADAVRFVGLGGGGPLSSVAVTSDITTIAEDTPGSPATLTISRTGDTTHPLTVRYLLSGEAASIEDYTGIEGAYGRIEIPSGSASTTLSIAAVDDITIESDESVVFTLVDSTGYELGTASAAALTILENDVNTAPVAVDDSASGFEDDVTTIFVLENDSDIDLHGFYIDSATTPSYGTVEVIYGNRLEYTPNPDFHGTDSFQYMMLDGYGGVATATVTMTIEPTNDPPEGAADGYSAVADTLLSIPAPGLLANDTDIDPGETLSVFSATFTTVNDADVVMYADGSFTYDPRNSDWFENLAAGEIVEDSFSYWLHDSEDWESSADVTVSVTGVNDSPFVIPDSIPSTIEMVEGGQGYYVHLEGVFYDPDGSDTLSFTVLSNDNPSLLDATITDGLLALTSADFANGAAQIVVRATGNAFTFVDLPLNVTVADIDSPVEFDGEDVYRVMEDSGPHTISLDTLFSDGDSALNFILVSNDNPALANAQIVGNNLQVELNPNEAGVAHLLVHAIPSGGVPYATTLTFVAASQNDPPQAVSQPVVNVPEDSSSFVINLDNYFSDPDSTLTYELVSFATQLISSAEITGSSLAFSPIENATGSGSVVVRALDHALGALATIDLSVGNDNDPPVAQALPAVTLTVDQPRFELLPNRYFWDVEDGRNLSYEVVAAGDPTKIMVELIDGKLSLLGVGGATGTEDITLRATDSQGVSVEQTMTVTLDMPYIVSVYLVQHMDEGHDGGVLFELNQEPWLNLPPIPLVFGGTAAQSTDYESLTTALVFDGSRYDEVRLSPLQDAIAEGAESIDVQVQGYGDASASLQLLDDDQGPMAYLTSVFTAFGQSQTYEGFNAHVELRRAGGPGSFETRFSLHEPADGAPAATAADLEWVTTPYASELPVIDQQYVETLFGSAHPTSELFTVATAADDIYEDEEHLLARIASIPGFTMGPREAQIFIKDNPIDLVDLDVDSDRSGAVDGTPAEDDVEGQAPGAPLVSNTSDTTANGVPDYADGFTTPRFDHAGANRSAGFHEMVVRLPEAFDRAKGTISFDIRHLGQPAFSDPLDITIDNSGPSPVYQAPSGLRIWAKDGAAARNVAGVQADGDLVIPGVQIPTPKLFEDSHEVTLYVEGVNVVSGAEYYIYTDFVVEEQLEAPSYDHVVFSALSELSVSDPTAEEGEPLKFEFSLSTPLAHEFSLEYWTVDGTAISEDGDYTPVPEAEKLVVHFPAWTSEVVVEIDTLIDGETEPDETMQLHFQPLGTMPDALVLPPPGSYATGTIIDNPYLDLIPTLGVSAVDKYGREAGGFEISGEDVTDTVSFVVSRGEGVVGFEQPFGFQLSTTLEVSQLVTTEGVAYDVDVPLSGLMAEDASSVTFTFAKPANASADWDETITIELMESADSGSDYASSYGIDHLFRTADATFLGDAPVQGLIDRNIDTVSTGLTQAAIVQGPIAVNILDGSVEVVQPFSFGSYVPRYRADDQLHMLLPLEVKLPDYGSDLVNLKGQVRIAELTGAEKTFDADGVDVSDFIRLVLPGPTQLAEELATGHYDYTLHLTASYADGESKELTIVGSTEIVNLVNEEFGEAYFGKRWWLDELDRIVPFSGHEHAWVQEGLSTNSGVAYMRGDNTSGFYEATADKILGEALEKPEPSPEWKTGTYAGSHYLVADLEAGASPKTTWKFVELDDEKLYQVYTTWTPGPNRTEGAVYTFTNGEVVRPSGANPGGQGEDWSVIVDQRFAPSQFVYGKTYPVRSLGYFNPESGQISVELATASPGAMGELIAGELFLVEDWSYTTPSGSYNHLEYGGFEDNNQIRSTAGYTYTPEGGYWHAANFRPEPGHFTLLTKYGSRTEFDADGTMRSFVDRNNNTTVYTPVNDKLSTISTQGGLQTSYAYEGNVTVTDFTRTRTTVLTLTDGRIEKVTEPDPGHGMLQPETVFFYSGPYAELHTVRDPDGNVNEISARSSSDDTRWGRNADGTEYSVQYFLQDATEKIRMPADAFVGSYDEATDFRPAQAIFADPRYHKWTYQVDRRGLETAMRNPAPFEDVWRTTRHENGLVKQIETPEPHLAIDDTPAIDNPPADSHDRQATAFTYDNRGNVNVTQFPDGTTLDTVHSERFSQLRFVIDQRGRLTSYFPDRFGNTHFVNASNRKTRMTYTPRPSFVFDVPGGLVEFRTEAYGSKYAVTSRNEYYDHFTPRTGLLKKTVSAVGTNVEHTTYHGYDDAHNLSLVTNNPSRAPFFDDGVPIADEYERTQWFTYDALDRLYSEETRHEDGGLVDGKARRANQPIARYVYYASGDVKEMYDAAGNKTEYEYDGMHRQTLVRFPAPGGHAETDQTRPETRYAYDPNGNLEEVKVLVDNDNNFRIVEHDYDERNLLESTTHPAPGYSDTDARLPSDQSAQPVVIYSRDALGNVIWEADPRFGRKALASDQEPTVKTEYAYDRMSRVTSTTTPAPHGASADPVTTVVYYDDGAVHYTESPNPNGGKNKTEFVYDSSGRLWKQTNPGDGKGNQLQLSYRYDLRDNVLSVTERNIGSTPNKKEAAKTRATRTTYDAQNRIIAVDGPDAASQHLGVSTYYLFNPAGEVASQLVFSGDVNAQHLVDGQIVANEMEEQRTAVINREHGIAQQTDSFYDARGRLRTTVGPRSLQDARLLRNEPTDTGDPVFWDDRLRTIHGYNALGLVDSTEQRFTDHEGVLHSFSSETKYDKLGRVWKTIGVATNAGRQETTTIYTLAGEVRATLMKDPNDLDDGLTRVEYTLDKLGRVRETRSDDPDSSLTSTGDGLAGGATKLNSKVYRDALGQVTRSIDVFGLETRRDYDRAGLVFRIAVEQGRVWLSESQPAESGAYLETTTEHYVTGHPMKASRAAFGDSFSRVAFEDVRTYDYDNLGQLVVSDVKTVAGTAATKYMYDAFGAVTSVRDPSNNLTTFDVDALGRIGAETQKADDTHFGNWKDATRNMQFDSFGNVISVIDANKSRRSFSYDNLSRRIKEEWPAEAYHAHFGFTPLGDALVAKNAEGGAPISEYRFSFESPGRVESQQQIQSWRDGTASLVDFAYQYDLQGRLSTTEIMLPEVNLHHINTYVYNGAGRLVSATQTPSLPGSAFVTAKDVTVTTELGSSPIRMVSERSANGIQHVWYSQYFYDSNGPGLAYVRSSDEGKGIQLFHRRSPRGLIAQEKRNDVDASGESLKTRTTNYDYGLAGQLIGTDTTVTVPGEDSVEKSSTFAYDKNGNPADALIGGHNKLLGNENGYFEFDASGNMTRRWVPRTEFDHSDFPLESEYVTNMAFNVDRPGKAAFDVGLYFIEVSDLQIDNWDSYDDTHEMEGIRPVFEWVMCPGGSACVGKGQPASPIHSPAIQLSPGDGVFDYFDGNSEGYYVLPREFPFKGQHRLRVGFEYVSDELSGRRAYINSGKVTVHKSDMEELEWNSGGQLASVTKYGQFGDPVSVQLQLPGAVISNATMHKKSTIWYRYDALGHLLESTHNKYVVDRGQRHAVYHKGSEEGATILFPAPGSEAFFSEENFFAHATSGHSSISWPIQDLQGSVVADLNSPGASDPGERIFHSITYSVFGRPQVEGGPEGMRGSLIHWNAGREYHESTGLYYNGARWYDPTVGRFISQDPIGLSGGDGNRYRYAANSFPNATDPSGKVIITTAIVLGGLALAGGGFGFWGYMNHLASESADMGDMNSANEMRQYGRYGLVAAGAGLTLAAAPFVIPAAAAYSGASASFVTAGYATAGVKGTIENLYSVDLTPLGALATPVSASFGALSPYGAIGDAAGSVTLGGGEYLAGGQFVNGRGWNLGGMLGSGIGGGFDDIALRGNSFNHAFKQVGAAFAMQGTAFAAGYATGGFDRGLAWANYASLPANVIAARLVPCFVTGTPVLIGGGAGAETLVAETAMGANLSDPRRDFMYYALIVAPMTAALVTTVVLMDRAQREEEADDSVMNPSDEEPEEMEDEDWVFADEEFCEEVRFGDLWD